jgi:hypothetical protein
MNGNGAEVINFTLTAAVADRIRDIAEAEGRPIGEVLQRLIERGIRSQCTVRRQVRKKFRAKP